MKRTDNKSHCPINFSLELIGDPWSLLIVRDIVYFGKKTFGEFLNSQEHIATNILTARLRMLEEKGVLQRHPLANDKRKDAYALTEKGLGLVPLLLDLADWGALHGAHIEAPQWWLEAVRQHRNQIIDEAQSAIRSGSSIFMGVNSVARYYAPKA